MKRGYFLLMLCILGIFSGAVTSRNPALPHKLNHFRRQVFLFPGEIGDLQHKLQVSHARLLKEREFRETLIKQSLSNEPYIVVSLTDNMLYLKQRDKTLRSCLVATGKQEKAIYGAHTYHFFTPRQVFTVWKKEEKPLWIMPDWAYHEAGEEAPPLDQRRGIPDVLGAYALYLQDGYMIHGTTASNDLGKYLTHGCVRMGKQDLQAVYNFVPIGTKVYVY